MPLRDFVCTNRRCRRKQERYQATSATKLKCEKCGSAIVVLPRSNEGPGHTTHVRIK